MIRDKAWSDLSFGLADPSVYLNRSGEKGFGKKERYFTRFDHGRKSLSAVFHQTIRIEGEQINIYKIYLKIFY
jgi:hypothetical protein